MKTNELIGTIPEHMGGNLSHSETVITLTLPDGKYLKFDKSGDDLTLDGKELTRDMLVEKLGKEKLREWVEPEVQETEVSQSDILAAMIDLNDRVNAVESGKTEPVEKTGLWTRIKAVFTG
jgi:hypothetical protein